MDKEPPAAIVESMRKECPAILEVNIVALGDVVKVSDSWQLAAAARAADSRLQTRTPDPDF